MDRAMAWPHTGNRWPAASMDGDMAGKPPRSPLLPGMSSAMMLALLLTLLAGSGGRDQPDRPPPPPPPAASLDEQLAGSRARQGFTGTVEQQLDKRLGRPLDFKMAGLGLLLFFDPVTSLHQDNSCAACHSPSHGYGDTQSIAIGIQNNGVVGPNRLGPRNLRRAPIILNAGFYPKLMWNGRFSAPSGDPFENAAGFSFPQPQGRGFFRPGDPLIRTLLAAQAFMPLTELVEEAGFTGIRDSLDPRRPCWPCCYYLVGAINYIIHQPKDAYSYL